MSGRRAGSHRRWWDRVVWRLLTGLVCGVITVVIINTALGGW